MKFADNQLEIYELEFAAGCPLKLAAGVLDPGSDGRRRIVSGRGETIEEAKFRCRMEAIERQLAVFPEGQHSRRGSYSEIAESACDPRQLILLSESQYAARHKWNETAQRDHHWPAPFRHDQAIEWVLGHSFDGARENWVPAAHCFLGYPDPLEQGFSVPDSNGLAAGKDLDDAKWRGLMELVERDAVSIWWYNRLQRPPLRVDRSRLPQLGRFEHWIWSRNRQLWFLDLRTDVDLPVAAAVSCNMASTDFAFGFGSGWTNEMAAMNAMGELVQFEATSAMRRADATHGAPDFVTMASRMDVSEAPYLQPVAEAARTSTSANLAPSALSMAQIASRASVVDLSRDGFAVARVIVPGLRHLWPRFAAGRLYDVPVQLGFREKATDERQLNPSFVLY